MFQRFCWRGWRFDKGKIIFLSCFLMNLLIFISPCTYIRFFPYVIVVNSPASLFIKDMKTALFNFLSMKFY